jgi:phage terminase large subunit-like protein
VTDTLGFVENEIVLSDGRTVGEGVLHDPWIRARMLAPVLERDDSGRPRYRLVYVELPRGHWKSGGAAAVATVQAALYPSTDVVVAAADTDQARIIFENVDGYLDRNPALGGHFRSRRNELLTESGSRIRVIASDAPSAYGLGGTHRRFRLIADELTAWKSDELWVALASASGKVEDAQTIVLSNAGFDAERSWQWRVRRTAETEQWGYLFSAEGVIASWITAEWVEQMSALLPSAAFERLIGNVWASGVGDFVTVEQWRSCVDERLVPQARGGGRRYRAGLDLGLVKDRTALAIVHGDGDTVVLDELQVWQGTRSEPVSITQIERAVVDATRRYPGLRVVADTWQLKGSIERLQRERVEISAFVFGASSVGKLSTTLHHAITSARLRVYPDPELEREILGLRVVETAGGWRFDHRAGGFSDRAVALAMALQLIQADSTSSVMRSFVARQRLPDDLDVMNAALAARGVPSYFRGTT